MAALDGRRPARTARHLLAAFAGPDTTRVARRDGEVARLRHPCAVGRWRDDRPATPTTAWRSCAAPRGVAAGPDRRVRAGLLAENDAGRRSASRPTAGPRPGARRAWSAATPLDWQPDAIWGQFNHAIG